MKTTYRSLFELKKPAKWNLPRLLTLLIYFMTTIVGWTQTEDVEGNPNKPSEIMIKIAELRKLVEAADSISEADHKEIASLYFQLNNKNIAGRSNNGNTEKDEMLDELDLTDVPFALIEEVPVFPGCESLTGNNSRKRCMSDQITNYVLKNFNTEIGKRTGMEGVNRIYVKFKISNQGNVEEIGTRAGHPALGGRSRTCH